MCRLSNAGDAVTLRGLQELEDLAEIGEVPDHSDFDPRVRC
jgi:hypothetical protein